ncbi:MAG: hypothetical protein AAFV07_07805 [Bacteroidota bacterium]
MQKFILLLISSLLFNSNLIAQRYHLWASGPVIRAEMALQQAVLFRLGYQQQLSLRGHPLITSARLGLPMGRTLNDGTLELNAGMPIRKDHGWNLIPALGFNTVRWQNDLALATSLEGQLGLSAGYFGQHWHAAFQVQHRRSMGTRLKHSDIYVEQYHTGAQSGWYKGLGGAWQFNLEGAYAWSRIETGLWLGLGLGRDGQLPLLPYVGGIWFGYRI